MFEVDFIFCLVLFCEEGYIISDNSFCEDIIYEINVCFLVLDFFFK